MKVFYAMLVERNVDGDVTQLAFDIGAACARAGFMQALQDAHERNNAELDVGVMVEQAIGIYTRIPQFYAPTDMARNMIVDSFLKQSADESDVLVMLDDDHNMPVDVVVRLALRTDATHEVVGALAFRRGMPHDPCLFIRRTDGGAKYETLTRFTGDLVQCMCVGTGAISIRRSVFDKLKAADISTPYFRYVYRDNDSTRPSEDFQFGLLCERAGIPHWADTSFQIPHLTKRYIGLQDWQAICAQAQKNPEAFNQALGAAGFVFSAPEGEGATDGS